MRKPVFEASNLVQYNFGFREAREEEGLYYLCSENKGADQLCDYRTADLLLFTQLQKAGFLITRLISYFKLWCTEAVRCVCLANDALPWRNCCICTVLEGGPFMQNVIPYFQGDSTCNLALKGQAVSKKKALKDTGGRRSMGIL